MSVELVLAAVAGADLCLKYGKQLVDAYQAFKSAGDDIAGKVLIIDTFVTRTSIQINFFRRVAIKLDPEFCRVQGEVLKRLNSKLEFAIARVRTVMHKNKSGQPDGSDGKGVKRIKYLFIRDSLNEAISELERWQRIFDPTWFLILRINDQAIDMELSESHAQKGSVGSPAKTTLDVAQKLRGQMRHELDSSVSVSLGDNGLDWEKSARVEYSDVLVVQRAGSKKTYAVESISCAHPVDVASVKTDAESLARKLKQIDAQTFHLLTCHGIVKHRNEASGKLDRIDMVFRMPQTETPPVSLRWQLIQEAPKSLSDTLSTARQLAKAVSFVHTCNLVHKNIRPETILILENEVSALTGRATKAAYLLGFDSFRAINLRTMRRGDNVWSRNLYRHPSRQGTQIEQDHVMQHDVYSLGVCLLELGMRKSFVGHAKGNETGPSSEFLELLRDQEDGSAGQEGPSGHSGIKDALVEMAQSRLPCQMGDMYTAVVVTCLTCLDEENEDFGNEQDMCDDDGILIGLRFIEKVLIRLDEICM